MLAILLSRKSAYGNLDGNPLSLNHFRGLDPTIEQQDLDGLVKLNILKAENYAFSIESFDAEDLSDEECAVLQHGNNGKLVIDDLKSSAVLKLKKISVLKTVTALLDKDIIVCEEVRYDFKNTKISTGLFGVNRIFLPTSDIFPTLVASDSNDYITLEEIRAEHVEDYKRQFIERVYKKNNYRKITKEEACLIQGFPEDFMLPESRVRWMRLLGNSVSVPVVEMLGRAIVETGVLGE
jgi:DNA (cytosine-5)-methyltransferase 1